MIAWSLAPGLGLEAPPGPPADSLLLTDPVTGEAVPVPLLDPGLAGPLLALRGGPRTEDELVASAAPFGELLERQLTLLLHRGALALSCRHDGRELLRVQVGGELGTVVRRRPEPADRIRLSRFACLRRVGGELVVESPTG
ncbi:hypothetical protein ACFW1A_34245, partial [Kitasatospora sp. NPDC058965]|uniref:hypothetical protein n=1 Tax=Kitasatospora sp. NPDC058965 TaxID=3346682 RepID=UPI00369DD546